MPLLDGIASRCMRLFDSVVFRIALGIVLVYVTIGLAVLRLLLEGMAFYPDLLILLIIVISVSIPGLLVGIILGLRRLK